MQENTQNVLIVITLVLSVFSFIWHWRNILFGIDKLIKEDE